MLAAAARSRVSLDVYDVADPYGGSADQHRIAAETILAATTTIAAGLTPRPRWDADAGWDTTAGPVVTGP